VQHGADRRPLSRDGADRNDSVLTLDDPGRIATAASDSDRETQSG